MSRRSFGSIGLCPEGAWPNSATLSPVRMLCCSRSPGEAHLECGTTPGCGQASNGCPNALTGLSDNGKAKPASRPRGPRTAPKALEQMGALVLGDAGAAIHYAQDALAAEGDGNLGP